MSPFSLCGGPQEHSNIFLLLFYYLNHVNKLLRILFQSFAICCTSSRYPCIATTTTGHAPTCMEHGYGCGVVCLRTARLAGVQDTPAVPYCTRRSDVRHDEDENFGDNYFIIFNRGDLVRDQDEVYLFTPL